MLSILTECRISLAIQSSLLGRAFDTAVPGRENLPSSKRLDIHMSGLEGNGSGRVLWLGLLLFVLALGLRVLFLQTIPDAAGSYDPYYKGDTETWLDYAQAIQSSRPFDLGIPLRPPGVAYVVAFLWNGQESGLLFLKLIWSIFGAAAVALFFFGGFAVFRSQSCRHRRFRHLRLDRLDDLVHLTQQRNPLFAAGDGQLHSLAVDPAPAPTAYPSFLVNTPRSGLPDPCRTCPLLCSGFGLPDLGLGAVTRPGRGMETKPGSGRSHVDAFYAALDSLAAAHLVADRAVQPGAATHKQRDRAGVSPVGAGFGRTPMERRGGPGTSGAAGVLPAPD